MKTIQKIKYLIPICLIAVFMWNCEDDLPKVEELPSPEVAFTYEVVDEAFQLDYYVGSNIQFINTSKANGEPIWDFGDGNTAQGDTVVHRYEQPGTYQVKLTIEGKGSLTQKIFISDIKPILTLNPIEGGICEVLTGKVSFNVIVPNPQNLPVEYKWIFPEGTKDEYGNDISIFEEENPGKIIFSNVGSQKVRLQVKLGGRELDETSLNVPVGYNSPVPTLYYAAKDGNIMALKLVTNAPQGMKIYPFDMGVKSGQHPLNILFNDTSLYILDCGKQFTYINDVDGVLGDGRILVMSKDGSKVETMLTNKGAAFDDPFYGYIEGNTLYFSDRNTGIRTIELDERNKSLSPAEFPYYVQNATLGYYGKGLSYGAMNACFGKVNNVWYWCKTYNGNGIFRFTDADILKEPIAGGAGETPSAGIALEGMSPKSFVWDAERGYFYFSIYDPGYGGLYRCTLDELNNIKLSNLASYKCTLQNGKMVAPIIETGKGEGSTGEFIGICQLALDERDGCVYFGYRSSDPSDIKSGLMRYNPTKGYIEPVIEGVDIYGVAINKTPSKLF